MSGMSGWTDDGTVVRLTDSTDQVGIGTALPAPGRKVEVTGLSRLLLEDKGGEVYNVKAYGAVGDGTNNDTSAIQDAHDAMPATGGALYFPPGTYRITAEVSITKPCTLFGAGPVVSIIAVDSATANGFHVTSSSPVSVRDLSLRAAAMVTKTAGALLLYDSSVVQVVGHRVLNCEFQGHFTGIETKGTGTGGAQQMAVVACLFRGPAAGATDMLLTNTNSDAGDHVVLGCAFINAPVYAIRCTTGGSGLRVTGCKFVGGKNYDIYYDMPAGSPSTDLLVTGCSLENAKKAVLRIGGAGSMSRIVIAGNEIQILDNDAVGILLDPAGAGAAVGTVNINGNLIQGGLGLTGTKGIHLNPASGASVDETYIQANTFASLVTGVDVAAGVGKGFARNNAFDTLVTNRYSNLSPSTFVVDAPACRVIRTALSGDQVISSGVGTIVLFDDERFDTNGMHDNATNNSRITIRVAGKYLIGATIQWDSNGTGLRQVELLLNGATTIGVTNSDPAAALLFTRQEVQTMRDLAVNDFVEVRVRQDSGGDLAVKYSAEISPIFWAVRVSD